MNTFTLKASADDLNLAVAVATPDTAPKGIFQIVHGMCEHKELYYPFMEWLASKGYAVICHDHRGHGASVKSPEDLGFFYEGGWKACVDDVKVVGDWARREFGPLEFTLFGHSMGSMVVRCYTKRYDSTIDRLIVCGCPSDNPAKGVGKALATLIGAVKGSHNRPRVMQMLSFGTYNKPFRAEGYPAAWVCSDKDTLKAYHNDPLCQFVFTANGFRNLLSLMQDCYSKKGWAMKKPSLPIHFLSGADDPYRISDEAFAKAVEFIRARGYKTVDSKLYPGMRHEILNETDKEQVWNDILALLNE